MDLSNNRIGEKGCSYLANRLLKSNCYIQNIDISNNNIDDHMFKVLIYKIGISQITFSSKITRNYKNFKVHYNYLVINSQTHLALKFQMLWLRIIHS